jgi:hypothetical protein
MSSHATRLLRNRLRGKNISSFLAGLNNRHRGFTHLDFSAPTTRDSGGQPPAFTMFTCLLTIRREVVSSLSAAKAA